MIDINIIKKIYVLFSGEKCSDNLAKIIRQEYFQRKQENLTIGEFILNRINNNIINICKKYKMENCSLKFANKLRNKYLWSYRDFNLFDNPFVNIESFEDFFKNLEIILIYIDNCSECKKFEKIINKYLKKNNEYRFTKINCDDERAIDLGVKYNISYLPACIIRNNVIIELKRLKQLLKA